MDVPNLENPDWPRVLGGYRRLADWDSALLSSITNLDEFLASLRVRRAKYLLALSIFHSNMSLGVEDANIDTKCPLHRNCGRTSSM